MIQNTHALMIFLIVAGLLSLIVSFILIFVNKGNTIASRLLGGCMFCLSLGSFDGVLRDSPAYLQSTGSYIILIAIFFGLPLLAFMYVRSILSQKDQFAENSPKQVNIQWIGIFPVAIGIIWLIGPVRFIMLPESGLSAGGPGAFAVSGFMFLLCLYLFFHPSLLYGSIWQAEPVKASAVEIEPVHPKVVQEKNQTSRASLSIEQTLKFKNLIKEHFAATLAFRKPGYTIRDLSIETGIPGYLLSLFINQEYGMNFNEMTNAYRVEYLSRLLITSFDCKSYTLEALGKMAGFNSRTAFIAAIKKHTGMTPSVFFSKRHGERNETALFSFPGIVRKIA